MTAAAVCFFHDRGFYAWAIRLWTRSQYAHCTLMLGDRKTDPAVIVLYADQNGVNAGVRSLSALTPDLEIPIELPDGQATMNFATLEQGSAYDWKGILLSQVVGLRREHPDRWFCSEYVAALLRAGGYPVPRRNCEYSPEDIRKLVSS